MAIGRSFKALARPDEAVSDAANIEQIEGKIMEEGSNWNNGDMDLQGDDEASRLRALATDVRDQDDLERDIGRQVRSERCSSCRILTMFY